MNNQSALPIMLGYSVVLPEKWIPFFSAELNISEFTKKCTGEWIIVLFDGEQPV